MIEDKTPIVTLSKEDSVADEMKRIQKLIKKYKVSAVKANKTGIISRGINITKEQKRQLKGLLPDAEDKANIEELIKTYNIAYPYPHIESIQMAVEEGLAILKPFKFNRKSRRTKTGMTLTRRLPIPFVNALKVAYPILLTDKVQSAWFKENFPELHLIRSENNESK